MLDGLQAAFTANVDPELYGRWGQWAAFSPVTRFHGLGRREPTAYPEPWRTAVVKALQLRRRLIPYLNRAHRQSVTAGLPLMRPTALTHPDNLEAIHATTQYQLGDQLLVAPVLQPGGQASIWLPDADWIPLLGAPTARPGTQSVTVGPHSFPIYSRAELAASL
jgi:alpha-D-xyloside xylohydrolase